MLQALLKGNTQKSELQLEIGQRYAHGVDTLIDYTAAAQHYEKAARQGSARGKYELAKCYFRGAGVSQDYKRAQELLQDASKEYFLAFRMLRKYYTQDGLRLQQDFSKFPGLQAKAAKGDRAACTAMGNCFYMGSVGYQDYAAAAHWYRKAAEKDDPEAQFCLGYAYTVGAGVLQDKRCGFKWFEKAAAQDFVPAIHNLTVCYACSCGTEPDPIWEAIERSRLENRAVGSAEQGKLYSPKDLWTDRQLDKLTNILYPNDNKKEETIMKKILKHDEDSCWAIASVLAEAEDGDRDAQCAAGERFWYGDLVREDRSQAVYWYTQAAVRGHAYAQCCLAYAYALGEGVEKDLQQAVHWYAQAAAQGDCIGIRSLAACYAGGFGVEQDPVKAYRLVCDAMLQYRRPARTSEGFDRP